jgi:diguanylate cyclase (GGDEF)-like protein/PAS domain S-box-containing protein
MGDDGVILISERGEILQVNDRVHTLTGYVPAELVGATPPFRFAEAPELDARVASVLAGGRSEPWEASIRCKDGRERRVHVSLEALAAADPRKRTVLCALAEADPGSARRRTHGDLATEQAALRRVATAVARDAEREEIFALVAREVAELLGAGAGGVARFVDDEHAVLVGAWTMVDALRMPLGTSLPLEGDTVTARVRRSGTSARVDDYGALAGAGTTPARRSAVAAPVHVAGALWGTVGAVCVRPGGLPADAEPRLSEFAGLVTIAIASAEARAELVALAGSDPLTGLANRRTFTGALESEIARARRTGSPLGVVALDVDHFKRVNDEHGHDVGDDLLRALADRLRAVVRSSDTIARLGGEEFAWLLPGAGPDEALAAAERLRRDVAEVPLGNLGRVTISAGAAALRADEGGAGLLRRADEALYAAKRAGRNHAILAGEGAVAPALAGSR